MYKKLGVLLSASVLATAGLVPIISNGRNVQASTVDAVKDDSKLNYDDNEPIDSWMPDKNLQQWVLEELKNEKILKEDSKVSHISKKTMLKLDSLDFDLQPEDSDYYINPVHIKSFEGLQYAQNVAQFIFNAEALVNFKEDSVSADWNIVPDLYPIYQLKNLEQVVLFDVFPKNGEVSKIYESFRVLPKLQNLEIGSEAYTVLNKTLKFTKNNYKHLIIPFSEFLDMKPLNPFDNSFDNKFDMKVGDKILTYSYEFDNGKVEFKLITPNVSYNDISGKSVTIKAQTPSSERLINMGPIFQYYNYPNDINFSSCVITLFNRVEFTPENQNISDLTELYNKVKYAISYSGGMFNSQPGNSMKYKDEFNDKTMFGAMDYAHGAKDYDGLIKMMHDSVKKTHESIGSLQVNESKAKELGLNVDQLKSDLAKDSVPYDYSQDNDIDGINKQLDSFASVRAKYNKLVQQGVFDKSDYWTMNK